MRSRLLVVSLVLLLVVAAVVTLFAIQNSTRTTQLSLDLGFAAWQLAEPVPVPALIGLAFVVGALVGGGLAFTRSVRLARRVRRLEQEIAISGFSSGGGELR